MTPLKFAFQTSVFLFFLVTIKAHQACRHLDGEEESWPKKETLLLPSLPKGPVTPSAPNPGTYIPARSATTIVGEKGFAGHPMPPPLPPPPPSPPHPHATYQF
ncbi:hypothetical protein NMG60_11014093 [Bertholletia excelsa]